MNPFELVVAIVAMAMLTGIIIRRMELRHSSKSQPLDDQQRALLHEEVRELKERLKVLERITVEKENSLAKEIESLRDR